MLAQGREMTALRRLARNTLFVLSLVGALCALAFVAGIAETQYFERQAEAR
jgi:hypothetical protein